MNNTIDRIIFTLDLIEVHGEANLSRMLGCIQAVKELKAMIENSKEDMI